MTNPIIWMILWYIFGICGCAMIWYGNAKSVNKYKDTRSQIWCPTPRAITIWLMFGVFGGLTFIVGVIIAIIDWLEHRPKKATWWNSPICKKHQD